MRIRVDGKTEDQVKLVKAGNGVEFLGKLLKSYSIQYLVLKKFLLSLPSGDRLLVEYEIAAEDFQIKSIKNVSHAISKFVFKRRVEYHITNTFFQVNHKFQYIMLNLFNKC